jgi:hypothetical protein
MIREVLSPITTGMERHEQGIRQSIIRRGSMNSRGGLDANGGR